MKQLEMKKSEIEQYNGYIVIKAGQKSCIALNTKAVEPFVCWFYDFDKKGVYGGFYCSSYDAAEREFNERER